MTEQLLSLGRLTVDVLEENDCYHVTSEEAVLLDISENALARLRCVYLIVEQPLIYAQVIIPQATMEAVPVLKNLGARPLGKLLKENNAKRGEIFFAHCLPDEKLFESAILKIDQIPESLLWRYSVFTFPNGKKIMVSEVFLPAIKPVLSKS